MKKYFIWIIGILVIVLGVVFLIKPYFMTSSPTVGEMVPVSLQTNTPEPTAKQPAVIASQTSCVTDSDCVVWSSGCEDCDCTAVNKMSLSGLTAEKRAYCATNPPKRMCDLECGKPKCVNNVCVVSNDGFPK